MKALNKIPLLYKVPLIIVLLGILTAIMTAILVVLDLTDELRAPEHVSILHEIKMPVILASLGLSVLGFLVARNITSPLSRIGNAMNRIAQHDYETPVCATDRGDEIGTIATNLEQFKNELGEAEVSAAKNVAKGAAFESSSVAMIIVDKDLVIRDANKAYRELMTEHKDAFHKHWPDLTPENLIGQCIDRFHKNPGHQRHILADIANLPYVANITLEGLKFSLTVGAVLDRNGNYAGNTLEWLDVTKSQKNSSVVDAITDHSLVFELNMDGVITNANSKACSVTGYAIAELKGRSIADFAIGNGDTIGDRALWDKLRAGEYTEGKFAFKAKGGANVWLNTMLNPVCDAGGKPYMVMAIKSDVTAMENEARDKNSLLDAIGSSQAMIEFDPQGTVLKANKNFLAAMGYSAEQIVGKKHAMFVPPHIRDSAEYSQFWNNLADGQAQTGIFERRTNGDKLIFIQGAYNPVRDGDGKITRVLKVCSDVTEAELKRRQLMEEGKEQGQIIDGIAGGLQAMIQFDIKGNVLKANDNFFKAMGYGESEVIGQHHSMLVDPEYAKSPEYSAMWEDLRRGKALRGTFKRFGKGNKLVYLEGSYNPVRDDTGAVTRVVKVVSDVTKEEIARLASVEAAKAADIERAKVVEQVTASLSVLAEGDLTVRLNEAFSEDFEILRTNFNDALSRLEETIASVMSSSQIIRDEAAQITHSADELAHRTENQAAALEETAASLEELTASVKAAAESAEKANTDVTTTRSNAEESGRIVRDAVDAMSEIEQSSNHISQIIGVIDDIAFQTNLLALNAGVEAARAGEAGRGFAVVASEVRALAQRSSDAAKEIKTLISKSSQQVGHGVDLVRKTGTSLETIVESVLGIASLVNDIANSSREQSVGLTEINTAVTQLDQVTQQNAAMVEESTAASHSMRGEADGLSELVSRFKADAALSSVSAPAKKAAPAAPAPKPKSSGKAAPAPQTAGSSALAVDQNDPLDDWKDF